MKAAIGHILSNNPKKVAVILGDMFELGEASQAEHQAIGVLLNENPPGLFIGIGPEMELAVAVYQGEKYAFQDVKAASEKLADILKGMDTILIKGSRGMALERLVQVIAPS